MRSHKNSQNTFLKFLVIFFLFSFPFYLPYEKRIIIFILLKYTCVYSSKEIAQKQDGGHQKKCPKAAKKERISALTSEGCVVTNLIPFPMSLNSFKSSKRSASICLLMYITNKLPQFRE
jgi:hypothetical protein